MQDQEITYQEPNEAQGLIRAAASNPNAFECFKRESLYLEAFAWRMLNKWIERSPCVPDEGYINQDKVMNMLHDIAASYGCPQLAPFVDLSLYLGWRANFLNVPHIFYERDDEHEVIRCASESPLAPTVRGIGYLDNSGPAGDVVDFSQLEKLVTCDPLDFNLLAAWRVLESDHRMPLGIVSYREIRRQIHRLLMAELADYSCRVRLDTASGLKDLASLTPSLQNEPLEPEAWVALIGHCVLLSLI